MKKNAPFWLLALLVLSALACSISLPDHPPAAAPTQTETLAAAPTPSAVLSVAPPKNTPTPPVFDKIITPDNAYRLAPTRQVPVEAHVGPNAQDLDWSPDGNLLAVANSRLLHLYNAATLNPVALPTEIKADELAFSPDGAYLAVSRPEGMSDFYIDLWRVADWTLAMTLSGHTNSITDLAFSSNGLLLASASMDGSVKLWNTVDGSLTQDLPVVSQGRHRPGVLSVAFSPNGETVVGGVYGYSIQGWQANNGAPTVNFQSPFSNQVRGTRFLADGKLLTFNSNTATIWQLNGTPLGQLESERGIYGGEISPDGNLLTTFDSSGLEFWDMENLEFYYWQGIGRIEAIAFSPDGLQLAVLNSDDDMLRVWEVAAE